MNYEELEEQRRKAWNKDQDSGVTCVCTTGGRFPYICEAIHQFLEQDYSHKKLLLFNNGTDNLRLDPSLEKEGISLINAGPNFLTYGEVLNAALSLVDTKYMATWDDDDIYLSNHLSLGIEALDDTGNLCYRSSKCLCARIEGEDTLVVDEVSNVLEATWIMNTGFVKTVGYDKDENVGSAIGIMEESNKREQTIVSNEITFIYRWGKITPDAIHISAFAGNPEAREVWLKGNSNYGLGEPLTPHSSNKLKDAILKLAPVRPVRLNAIEPCFGNDRSATHGKTPKKVIWIPHYQHEVKKGVRPPSVDVSVFIDGGLFVSDNDLWPTIPENSRKIGWILESPAISGHIYERAPEVLDNFEFIFTYSKDLLKLDPRFKFLPHGSHWIKNPEIHVKSKKVSMVASAKKMCPGHDYRHLWVEKLRHKLDFFGRGWEGIEPIRSKEEALNDYMFSVAMENCSFPNYFTEKLGDCLATGTIPIYWGCPNLGDFFNTDGIIMLDHTFDPAKLTEDLYYSKLDAIKENFEEIKKYECIEDYMHERYLKEWLTK